MVNRALIDNKYIEDKFLSFISQTNTIKLYSFPNK